MKNAVQMSDTSSPVKKYTLDPLFVDAPVGWTKMDGKGYGTIALRDIAEGEIIERSPAIIMPVSELKRPDGTEVELGNYVFHWGEEDENGHSILCACVKGGLLPLSNHSETANANVSQDHDNNMMVWYATRDIEKGEEVCIDYDTDLWFENREEK